MSKNTVYNGEGGDEEEKSNKKNVFFRLCQHLLLAAKTCVYSALTACAVHFCDCHFSPAARPTRSQRETASTLPFTAAAI